MVLFEYPSNMLVGWHHGAPGTSSSSWSSVPRGISRTSIDGDHGPMGEDAIAQHEDAINHPSETMASVEDPYRCAFFLAGWDDIIRSIEPRVFFRWNLDLCIAV